MPEEDGPAMAHGAEPTSLAQRFGFAVGSFVLLAVAMALASKLT